MLYLGLYILYLIIAGGLLGISNSPTVQFLVVFFQLCLYVIMFLIRKKTYDFKSVKEKVIEESIHPIHKRKTFLHTANWLFLVLVYLSGQVITASFSTAPYYISTILDFILVFVTMYPLVVESNIGLKKSGIGKVLVIAVACVFGSLVFSGTYSNIIEALGLVAESGDVSVNQVQVVTMIKMMPLRSFMTITFSAAIMEEWIFRGLGFRTLLHRNKFLAYLVTFVVFSLPHLVLGLQSSGLSEFIFMPIYGIMGVAFAMAYESTESIYTSMTAHFLNNLMSFVGILLSSML